MKKKKQESKKYCLCKKCNKLFQYTNADTFWDYSGSGYNTKLVICPECGCYIVLKYEDEDWLVNQF